VTAHVSLTMAGSLYVRDTVATQADEGDGVSLRTIVGWLLVMCVLSGCAGLEPGQLPTAEERCGFQRGIFRNGVCHTGGGA
jgi:hypothetical protein